MNVNTETFRIINIVDTAKIIVAVALVVAALAVFYLLPEWSLAVRVLIIVAGVILAALTGMQTEKGRHIWGFIKDAQIEVRKVVWPTRDETLQTTLVVVVMVVLVALFLWLLDLLYGWLTGFLLGHGG